jgi:hypothetical protein
MIFSGALGGVAEAASGAEEGTSDDTPTTGTTLAPDEAVPLGESDVLVSGRDGRGELSIGETLFGLKTRARKSTYEG